MQAVLKREEKEMNAKPRYEYLDVITGLLIIHMIIGHTLQFSGVYFEEGNFYEPVTQALAFFMPWFYFKSGLFANRNKDLRSWVEKDFRRLIVPFIVFSAIGAVFYYIYEFSAPNREWWKILFGPPYEVIRKGSSNGNLALWFLLSLFLTRLAYRLIPDNRQPLAIVVALICGAALAHWEIILPLTLSTVFPGFIFLMLGKYSRPYIVGDKLTNIKGGVNY